MVVMRPGEFEESVVMVIRVEDNDMALRKHIGNKLPDGTLSLVPQNLAILKTWVLPRVTRTGLTHNSANSMLICIFFPAHPWPQPTNRYDSEMVLYNSANALKRVELTRASSFQASRGVIDVRFVSAVPFKVLIFTRTSFNTTTGAQMLTDKFNTQLQAATQKIDALNDERSQRDEQTEASRVSIAKDSAALTDRTKTLGCVSPAFLC
jgi:hypothetical protein